MSDIKKDTFREAPVKTKFDMLYDICTGISETQEAALDKHDTRIKVLESRKIKNTALAAITGIIGGITAVLGKAFFK